MNGPSSMMSGNKMHLSPILSITSKAVNCYVHVVFKKFLVNFKKFCFKACTAVATCINVSINRDTHFPTWCTAVGVYGRHWVVIKTKGNITYRIAVPASTCVVIRGIKMCFYCLLL